VKITNQNQTKRKPKMAKYLKDILKAAHDQIKGVRPSETGPLSTGKDPGVDYMPKAADEADFIAKHSVQKWDEPYGNPNYADKMPYSLSKEKHHGNTISKAKAANEETINELSPATKKAYVAAATDDKKSAERQANHSEYTAKHAKTAKQKSDFSNEAKWLKGIAAKRARGIAMATKEETDPGFSESKKAEDVKCNMSEAGTWCPMHEMANCTMSKPLKELSNKTLGGYVQGASRDALSKQYSLGKGEKVDTRKLMNRRKGIDKAVDKMAKEEVEQVNELSTDLLHRAAHKAAKVAMTDVQGRSGPIFKKRAAQANKFRAKGMEQEKKEKAMKEDVELDEAMGSSTIKHKQNISYMSDKEFASKYKDRSDADLRSMAWRHGHGKPGTPGHEHYVNRRKKGLSEDIVNEKHLTPAEMKKREEVAQAIHRENPKMPMGKKMAIATSTAKKVAEAYAVEPLLQGDDEGGVEMVKAELKALANKAMHLVMQMPDSMHIEPWCQAKIANAKSYVNDVHDYMVYGDHDKDKEEDEGTTDTPLTLPNMSVDVNTGQNV
jgi:hypothetical protein